MIPSLEVLDTMTKDGEEFLSDMDDGDDYGAEEAVGSSTEREVEAET
jgi:hypothetical protein